MQRLAISSYGKYVPRMELAPAPMQHALAMGLPEIRLCTNEAMTENLDYYPRRGYRETHRATHNGYQRVFFSKVLH
jgi:hypothetical protein